MGGAYCDLEIPNCADTELHATYKELHKQALYDHGHSGYSGTFAEKPELEIIESQFQTYREARDYIVGHNDKWGPAMAVKVLHPEPHWYIGGWCSE